MCSHLHDVKIIDKNELNNLIEERSSRSKLYSSVVRDINTKSTDSFVNIRFATINIDC